MPFQLPRHAFFGQLAAQLVVVGPIHVQEIRSLTRHGTNKRASDVASTTRSGRGHGGADRVRQFTGRPRKSAVPGLAVKVLEVLEVAPRGNLLHPTGSDLGDGSDIWPSRSFLRMLRQMSSLSKKAAEIAADFVTTLYHAQIWRNRKPEFQNESDTILAFCFSDSIKGPIR